ncbi:TIGR02597 family protein [Mucisphaera calidilacus]|uniref:Uncharacterized protein n=1 Tax=Mucisphaera calidilacus TaxID=2527982 RepID=A0A518BUB2_9BACT|nr:TIGR02597 family protein [Mucisphaera calidilacus]QDU70593.1 hypothetical protein Pan265_04210 [Mucisphaera calidilacus]
MKTTFKAITAVAALALAGSVQAEVEVGYNLTQVPASADTRVSIPFQNEAVGTFTVASVNGDTVTFNDPDGVLAAATLGTNGAGRPLYYARFIEGDLAGRWFNVAAQNGTALSLTVEGTTVPATDLLASALANQKVVVAAHWTVEAIFPDGFEGLTFNASPSPFQPTFRVLIPQETDGTGIDIPSLSTLFYIGGDWRLISGQLANDFVVEPQGTITLRNPASESTGEENDPETLIDESTGNLIFLPAGDAAGFDIVESIAIENVQNDTVVGLGNGQATTLGATGIADAIDNSPSPFAPTDRILIYAAPTAGAGFDLPTTTTVIKFNGSLITVTGQPANDLEVLPGQVVIIRKAAGVPGEVLWTVGK